MASRVASAVTENISKVETTKLSPKITRKLRGKRTKAGNRVVLSCSANVNDETKIEWFKNGAKLEIPFVTSEDEGNRHRMFAKVEEDEIELVISNVGQEDAGYYLCVASNSQGEASSMAELAVKAWS